MAMFMASSMTAQALALIQEGIFSWVITAIYHG